MDIAIAKRPLSDLVQEAYRDAQTAGLPCPTWDRLQFRFNVPMGRSWGSCSKQVDGYTIKLSEVLCQKTSENSILNTIIHELIHSCGIMNHRADFKFWANKINARFPGKYQVSRLAAVSDKMDLETAKQSYKYIIQCPVCGMIFGKNRLSYYIRHPEESWCGRCRKKTGVKNYLVRVK